MPHCYVCNEKKARKLKSVYVNAAEEPIFCSLRCAADWALLWVKDLDAPIWCEEHRRWGNAGNSACCDVGESEKSL